MTDEEMNKLAAWYRSERQRQAETIKRLCRIDVAAYAESIGIPLSAEDAIDLFHHLNRRDYA